ncbi:MAG: PASTA domain-containing protein [Muribaculaceae bacterium]|nr:PASTA domain-containing protein [Muribaculaceae bacterium]
MNNREYNPLRNPGRSQRRNIEFSGRDFDEARERPLATGLRDENPVTDYDDYDMNRREDYYPDEEYYPEDGHQEDGYHDNYPEDGYPDDYGRGYLPEEEQQPTYRRPQRPERGNGYREQAAHTSAYPQEADRDGYRAGYRDGFRDNDASRGGGGGGGYGNPKETYDYMEEKSKGSFRKRHPILMNLLYAACATVLAIWMALWFLDYWTFHGQERAVPDVKGQSFDMAQGNISRAGLKAVVTDSVYDSYARPGTVVEQSPIPLAKIKRGGTVYLTLVAYTPKMVTIPDFYDVSERQARSMLEGLGITQVMTVGVPSEYAGLVLGAKYNGVSLRPGAKVPVSAVITLEVGGGRSDSYATEEIVDTVAIEQTIEALNID